MGRAPCCDKANVKRGPWSPEEDAKLKDFIEKYGTGGNWIALPQKAGLRRCGKSCRLRWLNYLRPNIKHGDFTDDEDRIICTLYASIGSRWSIIAAQLPGRTDNDIKNYWNTKLKKKLMMGMASTNQRKTPSFQTPPVQIPPFQSSTCPDPITIYQNLLENNSNSTFLPTHCSLLQPQESLFNPLRCYSVNDNFLMFGGTEASTCSSSDGSCSQISHGGEIKKENMGSLQNQYFSNGFEDIQKIMVDCARNGAADHHCLTSPKKMSHGRETKKENMGSLLNHYFSNGFGENQKLMVDCGRNGAADHHTTWISDEEKANGYFENNQLIQYDHLEEVKRLISTSNNSLFDDENKTNERGMYYYY